MNIVYAEEFWKRFRKLPANIQRLYRIQETRFRQNWRDPRLHVKKLTDHPLPFSFRITRNYRVLFAFVEAETALFATVGHRRESYRRGRWPEPSFPLPLLSPAPAAPSRGLRSLRGRLLFSKAFKLHQRESAF